MGTHSEAGLISLTSARAFEAWYLPRKPEHTSPHRFALHDFAANYIGRGTSLRFLEYGVHSGDSLRRFASIFTNPSSRFIGFDSFIGLPEGWSGYRAGHFSIGGQIPSIADTRVELVKGWFQNTARDTLSRFKHQPEIPTLVHFDADIYSSTLFLLSALWWHVPDYFFIMDEFIGEELAAMRNFVTAYPVELEFLSQVEDDRGQPVQVFGKLSATPMIVDGVG